MSFTNSVSSSMLTRPRYTAAMMKVNAY